MNFREMEERDLPALAGLYAKTFNSAPWFDKWTKKIAEKRLAALFSHREAFGLVSTEEEGLTGLILGEEEIYFDGVIFTVKEFCVKNELRGKGIGTALLKELEQRLRAKGIRSVLLLTAPEDEGFYQKNGYEKAELSALSKEL